MSLLSVKSQLINEVFMTKEYNYLRLTKNRLSENKELALEVKDYEKKMHAALSSNDATALNALETEYRRLYSINEIRAYFEATEAMHGLIVGIINDINSAIDNSLR